MWCELVSQSVAFPLYLRTAVICLQCILAVKFKKEKKGTRYELYDSHNDVDEN